MDIETVNLYHSEQDHIDVWEKGTQRWLTFGDDVVQSLIDTTNPAVLPLPPSQSALAALLFIPSPSQVLLLGMGGGSIARFIHHRQPDVIGHAVECAQPVVDVAHAFFYFPPEPTWRVIMADAKDYIATANDQYDYIVVDIATGDETPLWIAQRAFLQQLKTRLTPQGVVVLNLLMNNAETFKYFLWNIRQVFTQKTVCLTVPDYRNILLFAFSNQPQHAQLTQLTARVPRLQDRWGLPFDVFLAQMLHDNPAGTITDHPQTSLTPK